MRRRKTAARQSPQTFSPNEKGLWTVGPKPFRSLAGRLYSAACGISSFSSTFGGDIGRL